jgi:hypothetical protein
MWVESTVARISACALWSVACDTAGKLVVGTRPGLAGRLRVLLLALRTLDGVKHFKEGYCAILPDRYI